MAAEKQTAGKSVKKKLERTNFRELKAKEQSFCENYLIDHNGAQAAIRAGYAKKSARITASKLLTKANVQDEIQRLSNLVTEKILITTEDVVKDLIKLKNRCMQEEDVLDKDGNSIGIFQFDSAGANKALNRLGDYTGGFTKKLDHTSKGDKIEPTVLYMPDNGRA